MRIRPWQGLPERQWFGLSVAFFGLYLFATLVPRGDTWGLHAYAYDSVGYRIAVLVVCALLIWPPSRERVLAALDRIPPPRKTQTRGARWFLAIAVFGLTFVTFYGFPIKTEVYGDTRTILRQWTDNTQLPPLSQLLDFRFYKTDAALTQILVRTTAHAFSISVEQAFRLISALSGALSIALWLQFIRLLLPGSRWMFLLVLAGCLVGANQIFFGHVETYAFAYLTILLFLVSAYLFIKSRMSVWVVCLTFLLALKAHSLTICFVPALIYLGAWRRSTRSDGPPNWRWAISRLLVPFCVLGVGLYFFVFRSFAAPYTGLHAGTPQTFLPLVPVPGLRDYSMISSAHMLDLANVFLLVGMPVLLLLVGLALFHRRAVDWQDPSIIFTALAFLFPLLFLLAVNPLLSMPRDWDLFALLAAPLLLFLLAVVSNLEADAVPRGVLEGPAMAFGVFTVGFCILNASQSVLSPRLEQVGEHIFRTYHTNASYLIDTAQGMEPDSAKALARRLATIKRLEPYILGEDEEYTHLLSTLASVYRKRGDRERAVYWAERATIVAPHDTSLALYLADYLLWANEVQRAQVHLARVLQQYPSDFDALVLAAIAAARTEDYRSALAYLERAHIVAPTDPDIPIWTANMKTKLASQASHVPD